MAIQNPKVVSIIWKRFGNALEIIIRYIVYKCSQMSQVKDEKDECEMRIFPNPDMYKDVQSNLAGLQPQQLTTEEREALEARLQLQKSEELEERAKSSFVRRLFAWVAGLVNRSGRRVTPRTG